MKRRSFLGVAFGGVAAALAARFLPSQPNTTTWGQIAAAQRKIPYIVDNVGDYPGLKRDTLSVTFPAPADGQTHWLLYTSNEPYGSLGPHYRLK